ncbi:MAG TPA: alpha/beta hydrolase [Solirubrobacteraceae bacterium]|nr:alpha/beta hydrolase [Solirubrobacteraceae bacterium]
MAAGMAASLWPPSRSGLVGLATWLVSAIPNESPFLALYWIGASTLLALAGLQGAQVWVAVGLALAPFVAALFLVRRSLRAAPAVERALDREVGPQWRDAGAGQSIAPNPPWARVLFAPLPLFHPGVRRIANLSYGEAGRRNRLDLYRRRGGGSGGPVLIHLHGGGFSLAPGRKSFYARRLLFRLARQGWVCLSATYRLSGTFPDELIDVKKVIAWAREHASEHGGDPDRIVLAGSSFGARLATLAGFTTNDPAFQPGFEHADTSIAAVVGLYGYYGTVDSRQSLASSPFDYAERGCPPLLIVHGDQDTLTPPGRAHALAEQARSASANPVAYVELPGAQHSFDLLASIRFEAVIDGIQAFVTSVAAHPTETLRTSGIVSIRPCARSLPATRARVFRWTSDVSRHARRDGSV